MQVVYQQINDPARDAWQRPKEVIGALRIAPGAHVADIGAGGGYFTFKLAEAVGPEGRVYAADVDKTALRTIEKEARLMRTANVPLILATPNDPHLPQGGIDLIFTCNTYHHISERVTYFKAVARYLRPDGQIAIIEYKEGGWFGSLFGHATTKERFGRS